jgi:hypothetical protein
VAHFPGCSNKKKQLVCSNKKKKSPLETFDFLALSIHTKVETKIGFFMEKIRMRDRVSLTPCRSYADRTRYFYFIITGWPRAKAHPPSNFETYRLILLSYIYFYLSPAFSYYSIVKKIRKMLSAYKKYIVARRLVSSSNCGAFYVPH